MTVDPDRVARIIGEIADAIVAPRFGRLEDHEVRSKSGPDDLVTEVDEAAERALERALRDIYPAAQFIGEETVAREPARADALKGDGAFWVVDPLDGTRNFVRGVAEFGSIVALVEGGETRMGFIHATPERKTAVAVKGDGATWAGAPLLPQRETHAPPRGLRSISWLPEAERRRVQAGLAQFQSRTGHCSAYSYLLLARGEIDFKISSRIHPWDHLAGALILDELGGRTSFLETGAPLGSQPPLDRALLAVAPGRDWDRFATVLRGEAQG